MNNDLVMNSKKYYYAKRLRMLSYLIERGFKDYEVIQDPTSKKGYNWFVFKRSPELDKAVNEYFAKFTKR